ncbi:MAG: aspartate--tRNA ligase [Candidatus Promineifilaceae bacterium]
MLKSHSCGELRKSHIGQEVTLAGWVHRRRDMGGIIFIDLRDHDGRTQITIDASQDEAAFHTAESLRPEYVLQVSGIVVQRPEGQENPDLATGEIEVQVEKIAILNPAKVPPIPVDDEAKIDEALALKYRYIYLRRPSMQRNMLIRHKAIKYIRDFLDERGFLEIETPILFKSTPEGARDYLVPSRLHPGKFYALPQSPQQLKQLLMVAGFERYFQIAKCFRDEDLRSFRQPEFTQLDLEMSFVERDDVIDLLEEMMVGMVKEASLVPLASEVFPRLSHGTVLERFGTDRPDLRFGMELVDISDIAGTSSFKVFAENVAAGNPVKAICAPGCGSYSRKQIGELEEIAKAQGAKGLATMAIDPDSGELRGFITKFFTVEQLVQITERLSAEPGDLLLFASDKRRVANTVLGTLRDEFGQRLGYKDIPELAFCWIVDFPLFEADMTDGHYAPEHHMFTSPKKEHIPLLDTDPAAAQSEQYDLVCNGLEVGGGSIRIHDRELQQKIMELIGLSMEEAREQFGHLLDAFEYGTPPHGGIAPGIDRLVMLMAGESNLQQIVAFPKSQSATDLMADSPSAVSQTQLDDLHIMLKDSREDAEKEDPN